MWWAREDSNLQPSGYERVTLTGIINDYWHFRARSPTFVPVWLRRIIGYLLVGRWGAAPGLVSRGTDKAAASDIPGQPLRLASRIAFLQAAMGTSRRACSTVARRSNWKAMTGAATSADDEVDYYKALASLIRVKQPR